MTVVSAIQVDQRGPSTHVSFSAERLVVFAPSSRDAGTSLLGREDKQIERWALTGLTRAVPASEDTGSGCRGVGPRRQLEQVYDLS